jgi:aryl-alcohol dehydrogenase-like predicted oxidoreductase
MMRRGITGTERDVTGDRYAGDRSDVPRTSRPTPNRVTANRLSASVLQPAVMDEPIALPGCDVALSVMGLGTWAWGDRSTWGMEGYDRSYDFETIRGAYQRAIAAGITVLDTAEMYGDGESERIIGRLLRDDPAHRDRVVIATKFMPFPWRVPLRAALMRSLRASLERLGVPAVQLYQIHGPISMRPARAVAAALADAYRAGLVQAVGVSNYSIAELRAIHAALAAHGIPLATNQIEYSLLRTMPETTGLLRTCRELGVAVLAYSPLAMGRLTGKYGASNPPPGKRNFSAYPMAEIEPVVDALRRIGAQYGGKSPAQVALNWIICKGAVPIPGAKNAAQAEQNAGALGWRLTPEHVAALDRVAKFGQRTIFHRVWQHG